MDDWGVIVDEVQSKSAVLGGQKRTHPLHQPKSLSPPWTLM